MVPGRDRTRDPWICSQTRICNQTRYRLRYAARFCFSVIVRYNIVCKQKLQLENGLMQPSLSERVIVDGHGCHTALHFGVKAKENQDKVPTLYWLPKLHKKPYKARFIANSSSCTTTELSKLLTSCLTAVKNMLSNIVKKYMRDPVKTYFGRLKIQVKF